MICNALAEVMIISMSQLSSVRNLIIKNLFSMEFENVSFLQLDQAALGLSREYLSKGFDDKIVQAYYSYMVDIAVILGANKTDAKTELKESLEFEMKLANVC